MIVGFGGSSGFVVFCRTVDVVKSLSLETSALHGLFASGLFRQMTSEQGDGRTSKDP